jgi:predicted amidophosphoribosyltransferase
MGWFRKEIYTPPGVPLEGSFDDGWALDTHSCLLNSEWSRTVVGEKLYRFKYRGNRASGRWLARTCVYFLERFDPPWDIDIIISVPSSRPTSRLSSAEHIAAKIAKAIGASCLFRALYKTRPTRYVKEAMSFEHKKQIIENTMAVKHPELIKGKRLLLIDDLFETGATSDEAIRALRESNPTWIGFLAFTVVGGNR